MTTATRPSWLLLLALYGWTYAMSDLALRALSWAYTHPALGWWLIQRGYSRRLHRWIADVTDRTFPGHRCPRP